MWLLVQLIHSIARIADKHPRIIFATSIRELETGMSEFDGIWFPALRNNTRLRINQAYAAIETINYVPVRLTVTSISSTRFVGYKNERPLGGDDPVSKSRPHLACKARFVRNIWHTRICIAGRSSMIRIGLASRLTTRSDYPANCVSFRHTWARLDIGYC